MNIKFVMLIVLTGLELLLINASCEIDHSEQPIENTDFEGRLWRIVRYEYIDDSVINYPVLEGGIKIFHYHYYNYGIFSQYESFHFEDGPSLNYYNPRLYTEYEKIDDSYNFSNGEKWNCVVTNEQAVCVCSDVPEITVRRIIYEATDLKTSDFSIMEYR
ncbi:MAG: hypothetical protein PF637_12295 [Spirochaetes bacterium]|jgi:hypothetical protein|nr:hypothetical protein [Spirochaetota bacterium]